MISNQFTKKDFGPKGFSTGLPKMFWSQRISNPFIKKVLINDFQPVYQNGFGPKGFPTGLPKRFWSQMIYNQFTNKVLVPKDFRPVYK